MVVFSDFWSTDSFFPSEASLSLAFRGASIFSVGLSSEMMELYARDHLSDTFLSFGCTLSLFKHNNS